MLLRNFALTVVFAVYAQAAVPKELQTVADRARALPPEFAADILLKLAASPLVSDAKWKHEAIEDAFLAGAHTQTPYRLRGNPRLLVASAWNTRLGALTFQTRAVDAMLALDSQRALAMFGDIATPVPPSVGCQVGLVPDLSLYYSTAANLFSAAFTPEQRRKEADLAFLRARIGAVDSPSQVVPALQMLDRVELSPQMRSEMMAVFAGVLERVRGGNREFSASEDLLVGAAVPEMHETPDFIPALRAYIVRHLSGPRCSDQITPRVLPNSAAQFNNLLSRIDSLGRQVRPISLDEVTPLRDDGTFRPPTAGQSTHAKAIGAAMTALQRDNPVTQAWTAHYFEVLKMLESWKADDEAAVEDYWLLVAVYYEPLVGLAPSDAARKSTFVSFQRFVERQYGTVPHRLWYFSFEQLQQAGSAVDPAWKFDQLLHSSNAVISAYARLQELIGT